MQEPERRLARLLLVDPLQGLGQAPLRRRERVLLQGLVQARGPDMRPQRWLLQQQARLLFLLLLRRLLRVPKQGPLKGQALAQLSGRRPRRKSDGAISD